MKKKKICNKLIGTPLFCSVNLYNNSSYDKRDDMISLGYVLCYLLLKSLPWENKDKLLVQLMKNNNKKYLYINDLPDAIKIYLEYVINMKYNEIPDYQMLSNVLISEISVNQSLKTI